jgi:hypothetical protein
MVAPEEKAKRHAIKQALRQTEQERFRSTLPLAPELLRALFDFIDRQLGEAGCDNTLKYAMLFVSQRELESGRAIAWLESLGGFCDCEVLANVEERFLEVLPDSSASA